MQWPLSWDAVEQIQASSGFITSNLRKGPSFLLQEQQLAFIELLPCVRCPSKHFTCTNLTYSMPVKVFKMGSSGRGGQQKTMVTRVLL